MEVKQTINKYFGKFRNSVLPSNNEEEASETERRTEKGGGGGGGTVEKVERGASAGSVTSSQDEGIHSTGEKEEDDINEEDFLNTNEGLGNGKEDVNDGDSETNVEQSLLNDDETLQQEDDDEGRGSLAGDKIKDDDFATEVEESELENNANEEIVSNKGYIGDSDDTPSKSVFNKTYFINELKGENQKDLPEGIEENEDEENLPNENGENEGENEESNETEKETVMEASPNEAENEDNKDDTEGNTPEKSENEETNNDDFKNAAHEGEKVVKSEAAEEEQVSKDKPEEATKGEEKEEIILEVPKIANLPGTKRRKKNIIDMAKVTANRKPISIRPQPLLVPVSSKKENKNIKPHFESKTQLQKQNKFKLKTKKPQNISNERKKNVGRNLRASHHEAKENGIPSIALESNGNPDNGSDPQPSEAQDQLSELEKREGEREFLNPLMDHSLKRPVAPHQRDSLQSNINTNNNNRTTRTKMKPKNALGSSSEVWVPEENRLYVYSYSSVPRIIHVKRMGKKRIATTDVNDTDPNSPFKLKFRSSRIIRGSNFGKDLYETEEMRQRREEFRKQLRERAKGRRNVHGISSVYQSTTHHPTNGPTASVRRSTKKTRLSPTKKSVNSSMPRDGDNFHNTPRFRRTRPSISVATQVSEGERSSQLPHPESPEDAVIKALVANTLREAAIEVAAEAEADRAKMESVAARSLSAFGMGELQNGSAKDENIEGEMREDPEGKEMSPEEEEEEAPNNTDKGPD